MKNTLIIILALLLLSACQEVISPDIEKTESSLAVEGMISTRPDRNRVTVSTTNPFNEPFYMKRVNGLKVYVIDNQGNRINFTERNNIGEYITDNDTASLAKIGNTYTLFIESQDGSIYKSTPQTVNECPEIDVINLEQGEENILTENSNGETVELNSDGIFIYANTRGILPDKNFYLYRWYAYIEQHAIVSRPGEVSYIIYKYTPLPYRYISVISTGNADEFDWKYLKKNKFVFVPEDTYLDFIADTPRGATLASYFDGLLWASEQFSLSEDAYNFWKQAESQLNASNKLFAPVSSQINGNLSCVNYPDKKIYGVFYASDSEIRYDYLYINSKHKTYAKKIDSLPDISYEIQREVSNWYFPPY
jgi:hypothetical protein